LVFHFFPENQAMFALGKIMLGTLAIGVIPGMLILLVVRPLWNPTVLEAAGLGMVISLGLVQLLTICSLVFHISSNLIAVGLWGVSCLAVFGLFWKPAGDDKFVAVDAEEVIIGCLLLILALTLYLQGSPFAGAEDQIHIGVIRRLTFLQHPAIDNIYITPNIVYTYPFPGTHFLVALISRVSELDPLFVYYKLRFFWCPAALIFLYLTARMITDSCSVCGERFFCERADFLLGAVGAVFARFGCGDDGVATRTIGLIAVFSSGRKCETGCFLLCWYAFTGTYVNDCTYSGNRPIPRLFRKLFFSIAHFQRPSLSFLLPMENISVNWLHSRHGCCISPLVPRCRWARRRHYPAT
jgi:hypothetical protein